MKKTITIAAIALLMTMTSFIGFSQNAKDLTEKEVRTFVTNHIENQIGYKKAVKGYYDAASKNVVLWGGISWKNKPSKFEMEYNKDGSYKDDGSLFYEDSINVTIHDVYLMGSHANVMGTAKWYISGVNTTYRNFSCVVKRENGSIKYIRWTHADNSDLASNFIWPSTKLEGGIDAYSAMRDAMMDLNNEKALKISDSLVKKDPKWATAHLGQLQYYFMKGDGAKLSECYNIAVTKLEGASRAEKEIIFCYNPTNDAQTIMFHLDKALVFASDDPQVRAFRAWYEKNNKIAIDMLMPAWKRFPENGGVNNLMGYKYMDDGQMEKAKQHFEIYLRVYPKSANAHDSYGDYYSKAGDKVKAKEMFLKAYEIDKTFTKSKEKADKL
jgi:tetratricopeptide (TPR) repeat protein